MILSDANETTQQLSNTPRLRDTAARCERFLCVEDLADVADARVTQMREQAFERTLGATNVVGPHAHHRVDVWADQPAPHRALVISGITREQVTAIRRLVIW